MIQSESLQEQGFSCGDFHVLHPVMSCYFCMSGRHRVMLPVTISHLAVPLQQREQGPEGFCFQVKTMKQKE
jgi:hypothetical protein